MTPERAKQILELCRYANGGCLQVGAKKPDHPPKTWAEHDEIVAVWKTMPGYCSEYDAINSIAKGERKTTA